MNKLKIWIIKKKLDMAIKWAGQYGFSLVRLTSVGGRDYIVGDDGVLHRIGRKP